MSSRRLSLLVASLFVVFLLSPAVSAFLAPSTSEIENRRLAPFPELDMDSLRDLSFFEGLHRYVSDHMSVRTIGIRLSAVLHYHLLGESSNPEEVMVGNDGWLYLTETFVDGCDRPVDDVQVPDLIRLVDGLEAAGKTVLYTVAPDKMSIHPEHLTTRGAELATCSRRAGLGLEQYLEEFAHSGYIDLWDVFGDAAAETQVYFRTDSHFNYHGNRLFFEKIAAVVDPRVHLEWSQGTTHHYGNLTRSMGLGDTESVASWRLRGGSVPRLVEQADTRFGEDYHATEVYQTADPIIGGTMLVLKDSFMDLGMDQFTRLWDRTVFTDLRSRESVARFADEVDAADIVLVITAESSTLQRFDGGEEMVTRLVAEVSGRRPTAQNR